jgi:hypothetical protein
MVGNFRTTHDFLVLESAHLPSPEGKKITGQTILFES